MPPPRFTPRTHAKSPFPSGPETGHGLLYEPAGPGPHPGLIVIHEWWGLNDWIKEQAQRFAREGYVVLAVDLYRGQVATDADTAHQLSRGLPQDRGVRDLTSAAAWLVRQKNVDPHRIGAIGWCMGGGYAAQLAVADPTSRRSPSTTVLSHRPGALEKIHAAVLGNFGGQDRGITPDDVHAFDPRCTPWARASTSKFTPMPGTLLRIPTTRAGIVPRTRRMPRPLVTFSGGAPASF